MAPSSQELEPPANPGRFSLTARPWRSAFIRERVLPSCERGPVLRAAFFLFAAICLRVVIFSSLLRAFEFLLSCKLLVAPNLEIETLVRSRAQRHLLITTAHVVSEVQLLKCLVTLFFRRFLQAFDFLQRRQCSQKCFWLPLSRTAQRQR